MEELVSIIMPSYNTGSFIKESIDSVIKQSYSNWELIIVDDCSTDNTDQIVHSYRNEQRIRYYKNDKNSGAAVSRNKALQAARGKWIAFLDSDDLWESTKLEKQVGFMMDNGFRFSYTQYSEIDEEGKSNGISVSGPRRITHDGFLRYCWPGCLTVMFDKNILGGVQVADIRKNNDYAMWLIVSRYTACYLLSENLASYRIRSGSISNHGYLSLIKWHYRLYREAEKENAILSSFNTLRNLFFGVIKKVKYVKRK